LVSARRAVKHGPPQVHVKGKLMPANVFAGPSGAVRAAGCWAGRPSGIACMRPTLRS
jgi:hypothetical protein